MSTVRNKEGKGKRMFLRIMVHLVLLPQDVRRKSPSSCNVTYFFISAPQDLLDENWRIERGGLWTAALQFFYERIDNK